MIAKKEIHKIKVSSRLNENVVNLRLRIPPACPSLLNSTTNLIKNEYSFRFCFVSIDEEKSDQVDLFFKIPIEIGTVPILNQKSDYGSKRLSFVYKPSQSRGKNDDGNLKRSNIIKFFDPLYPFYNDMYY